MERIKVGRISIKNLVGKKFGRLFVTRHLGKGKHSKQYWECLCDCGKLTQLPTGSLTGTKPVFSCGCYRVEKLLKVRFDGVKHGKSKMPLYQVYYAMLYRCKSPKAQRWDYYGGKGIDVCEEWKASVENFINWAMKNGYKEGLSIDRVDNNKDYCPENCRWITVTENTRRAHAGKRRRTLPENI